MLKYCFLVVVKFDVNLDFWGKFWIMLIFFYGDFIVSLPVQRTGIFPSLYLIIKGEVFPWFGPSSVFVCLVSSVQSILRSFPVAHISL
jgi:hypothetical protein